MKSLTEQERQRLIEFIKRDSAGMKGHMFAWGDDPIKMRRIEVNDIALAALQAEPVADFILIDGEYQQLAAEFSESPDAIPLYATPPLPITPDGWIKCSDRMPECVKWDHAAVMASEGRNSFVAYYNKHDCKFLDEPFGESLGNKITHWQPLPAAPQQ